MSYFVRPLDHIMLDYTIQPFIGVGPVRLGMSRDEVRRVMSEPAKSFRKVRTSHHETDAFHQSAFQVFYGGDHPTVEYIELSRDSVVRALYRDLDVFATPADEVIAHISRNSEFDQSDPEIPYTYLFRGLQLSLWRPTIPESDMDTDGRYFSTIGIGKRGYYDVA
jgi:hypothetical protein